MAKGVQVTKEGLSKDAEALFNSIKNKESGIVFTYLGRAVSSNEPDKVVTINKEDGPTKDAGLLVSKIGELDTSTDFHFGRINVSVYRLNGMYEDDMKPRDYLLAIFVGKSSDLEKDIAFAKAAIKKLYNGVSDKDLLGIVDYLFVDHSGDL